MSQLPPTMSQRIEGAVDRAIARSVRVASERADYLRREYPDAEVPELVWYADRRFRRDCALASSAVGATASLPGVGTVVGAALSTSQLATYLVATASYVLTVAHLRGVDVASPERRRLLVLAALTGREGSEMVGSTLGVGLTWAAQHLTTMPLPTARELSAKLLARLARHHLGRSAAVVLGRLIPLGIGAAVGWATGRAMAETVIAGTEVALGHAVRPAAIDRGAHPHPADRDQPQTGPDEIVIDQ